MLVFRLGIILDIYVGDYMRKLYPWEEKAKKDEFVQDQIRVEVPILLPVDSKKEDDKLKDRGIVVIDLFENGI